jgi:seryl-tRNA synthetase
MTASVHTLELGRALDPELSAELEKLSTWVSPRVRDVRVGRGGRSVCFTVDGGESAVDGERAKVARFVADLVERHRVLPRRIVAQRTRRSGAAMDVYDELVRRGWVVECGPGRVSLRGPALRTVQALDEDCARIAIVALGAVEEAHASLVPASVLARCGWFGSFPQTASFVSHLAEDYDAIERFRCSNVGEPHLVAPVPGALATIDASLLPALCYAVYAAREGSVVPSAGVSVTCAGRCYRYESRNMNGLERLWEFSMREVVFLGGEEAVECRRARAIELVMDQLERWDLDGAIETANDPFFPAAHAAGAHWQRSGERKLELRLPVGGAAGDGSVRTAACASLNLHDRFFGSAFAIGSAGGEAAASGCVGWGMERWMLACFAQHGLGPEAWPRWLRSRVFR